MKGVVLSTYLAQLFLIMMMMMAINWETTILLRSWGYSSVIFLFFVGAFFCTVGISEDSTKILEQVLGVKKAVLKDIHINSWCFFKLSDIGILIALVLGSLRWSLSAISTLGTVLAVVDVNTEAFFFKGKKPAFLRTPPALYRHWKRLNNRWYLF